VFNALNKCFLSLTDPSLIQEFFQKQENYVKEESFLVNRTRLIGKGVAFSEGQDWSRQRKILSHLFHFSYFSSFSRVIEGITDSKIS
jgi:cytochrome P450